MALIYWMLVTKIIPFCILTSTYRISTNWHLTILNCRYSACHYTLHSKYLFWSDTACESGPMCSSPRMYSNASSQLFTHHCGMRRVQSKKNKINTFWYGISHVSDVFLKINIGLASGEYVIRSTIPSFVLLDRTGQPKGRQREKGGDISVEKNPPYFINSHTVP